MSWRNNVRRHIEAARSAREDQEYNRSIMASNEKERAKVKMQEALRVYNYYKRIASE